MAMKFRYNLKSRGNIVVKGKEFLKVIIKNNSDINRGKENELHVPTSPTANRVSRFNSFKLRKIAELANSEAIQQRIKTGDTPRLST